MADMAGYYHYICMVRLSFSYRPRAEKSGFGGRIGGAVLFWAREAIPLRAKEIFKTANLSSYNNRWDCNARTYCKLRYVLPVLAFGIIYPSDTTYKTSGAFPWGWDGSSRGFTAKPTLKVLVYTISKPTTTSSPVIKTQWHQHRNMTMNRRSGPGDFHTSLHGLIARRLYRTTTFYLAQS